MHDEKMSVMQISLYSGNVMIILLKFVKKNNFNINVASSISNCAREPAEKNQYSLVSMLSSALPSVKFEQFQNNIF